MIIDKVTKVETPISQESKKKFNSKSNKGKLKNDFILMKFNTTCFNYLVL